MDDRITEIREALQRFTVNMPVALAEIIADGNPAGDVYAADVSVLTAAARAYANLLDSDALIIRRDETGEWPEAVISRIHLYDAHGSELSGALILDYVENALASSQGVEPQ